MRYERVEDVLKLALLFQSSHRGLSINDIQEHFQVSRRTAERMRDAVVRLFPQIEEVETGSKIKRWTLKNHSMAPLVSFTPEELAELENTKKKLELDGLDTKAETIDDIICKIKVLNKKEQSKIETDLEALLEAEGYAIRQSPRFKVDKLVLEKIREAIKSFKKLSVEYKNKDNEVKSYTLHPYGLLYGEKNYLVAYSELREEVRLYILSNLLKIDVINEYFDKDEKFNLAEYAQNSFGIYQDKPISVVLEFDHSIVEEVRNYHFHPTQKVKEQKDGAIKVAFTAAGILSICWHLFQWGDKVKILKPQTLKNKYTELLEEALQGQKNK